MTQAIKVDEIIGLQEDMSAKLGVTIYVGMRPEAYGYPADWPDEEKKACQKKVCAVCCACRSSDVRVTHKSMHAYMYMCECVCVHAYTSTRTQVYARIHVHV